MEYNINYIYLPIQSKSTSNHFGTSFFLHASSVCRAPCLCMSIVTCTEVRPAIFIFVTVCEFQKEKRKNTRKKSEGRIRNNVCAIVVSDRIAMIT